MSGQMFASVGSQLCGHAAETAAETADDLIKNQQGAVVTTQLRECCEELRALRQQAVIGRQWFDDHRRNAVALIGKGRHRSGAVVQRQYQCVGGNTRP